MFLDITTKEIHMTEQDTAPQKSLWASLQAACGTPKDRVNNRNFLIWSLVWAVGLTVSSQTLKGRIFDVPADSGWLWIPAIVPVLLFLGLMRAFLGVVRGADELQRLIQLQALAVGFGAGILLLMHWELFEFVGAPAIDPSDAVMVPIFAWVISQLYFALRYR
jgi:hypothetical protein